MSDMFFQKKIGAICFFKKIGAFENNILIKLNRFNTVKLGNEVRLNLGQHFAFGITLRNKR